MDTNTLGVFVWILIGHIVVFGTFIWGGRNGRAEMHKELLPKNRLLYLLVLGAAIALWPVLVLGFIYLICEGVAIRLYRKVKKK